jgi:Plasmid stability protein
MTQVVIRNSDDAVVEQLKARAAEKRQSLEQARREILTEAVNPSRADVIEEQARWRAISPPLTPGAPLAEDLIRDDRDSR